MVMRPLLDIFFHNYFHPCTKIALAQATHTSRAAVSDQKVLSSNEHFMHEKYEFIDNTTYHDT